VRAGVAVLTNAIATAALSAKDTAPATHPMTDPCGTGRPPDDESNALPHNHFDTKARADIDTQFSNRRHT
jgi:hypothetical protein